MARFEVPQTCRHMQHMSLATTSATGSLWTVRAKKKLTTVARLADTVGGAAPGVPVPDWVKTTVTLTRDVPGSLRQCHSSACLTTCP